MRRLHISAGLQPHVLIYRWFLDVLASPGFAVVDLLLELSRAGLFAVVDLAMCTSDC